MAFSQDKCENYREISTAAQPSDTAESGISALSPIGHYIAMSNQDSLILYETDSLEPVKTLTFDFGETERFISFSALAWSMDEKLLAAQIIYTLPFPPEESRVGQTRIAAWAVETGALLLVLETESEPFGDNHSLSWSPDGRFIASDGVYDHSLNVWDVQTGDLVTSKQLSQYSSSAFIQRIAWSSDGNMLAFADGSDVHIYDGQRDWELTQTINTTFSEIRAIAWSADNFLAIVGGSIQIWNTNEWSLQQEFFDRRHNINLLAWSPSGEILAEAGLISGNPGVLLRYAADGRTKLIQTKDQIIDLTWIESDSTLAILTQNNLILECEI